MVKLAKKRRKPRSLGRLTDEQRELAEEYAWLVREVAFRTLRGWSSIEERMSCGSFGLIRAAAKWDPSHGRPFFSFAWAAIKSYIRNGYRLEKRRNGVWEPWAEHIEEDAAASCRDPRSVAETNIFWEEIRAKLDDRYGELVELQYRFGLGQREVSRKIGLAHVNVGVHTRRAISLLATTHTPAEVGHA